MLLQETGMNWGITAIRAAPPPAFMPGDDVCQLVCIAKKHGSADMLQRLMHMQEFRPNLNPY